MVSLLCTVNTNWFPAGTVITSGLNRSPFMSSATSVVFPVPPAVTTPEDPPEPPSTKPPNEAITSANTARAAVIWLVFGFSASGSGSRVLRITPNWARTANGVSTKNTASDPMARMDNTTRSHEFSVYNQQARPTFTKVARNKPARS